MNWLRTIILFNKGDILTEQDWQDVHESYLRCIASIDHPRGSGQLTLRRRVQKANKQWDRNGVSPLKERFQEHMKTDEGWEPEGVMKLPADRAELSNHLYPSLQAYNEPITSKFGGFDFAIRGETGNVAAIEWETGNISSSHRSMNKLCIALKAGIIDIGVLIVPSRDLYQHLTDRIGNIGELSGYLSMWTDLGKTVERGLLAVSVVEHDALTDDPDMPYLKTGTDGRAKQAKQ